ncbi:hypothetical protein DAEQUDRAFT_421926 [Daedalea quercina L-15889]|uniref:Uncharacterized protein n=1 Tax=Daedalea quercina L-15889 TaxID=1314783 RepID=A0A165TLY7_9APHY|nr:hypothetical protein DAEQUDRAFT_421926 [Daedalea quercina L-15889]
MGVGTCTSALPHGTYPLAASLASMALLLSHSLPKSSGRGCSGEGCCPNGGDQSDNDVSLHRSRTLQWLRLDHVPLSAHTWPRCCYGHRNTLAIAAHDALAAGATGSERPYPHRYIKAQCRDRVQQPGANFRRSTCHPYFASTCPRYMRGNCLKLRAS